MGIFRRAKNSVRSKANAAVDRAVDPRKQLERAIHELGEQRKVALQELLSYKTTAKQMERDLAGLEERIATWEKRAMLAIKAGDDEAARTCLREKRHASEEAARLRRDRDEAASYAIELNRSRKQVETKLRVLELKKGTMANQIAAARAGGDAFGRSGELFDEFTRAEDRIDEESVMAEVEAELGGEEGRRGDAGLEADLARAEEGGGGDDALAALKARMRENKQLKG